MNSIKLERAIRRRVSTVLKSRASQNDMFNRGQSFIHKDYKAMCEQPRVNLHADRMKEETKLMGLALKALKDI